MRNPITHKSPSLPQTLNWVFGSSASAKNNVINLSDGFSDRICYVAAHTGIIFDKRTRKQTFLQVRNPRVVVTCRHMWGVQGWVHAVAWW